MSYGANAKFAIGLQTTGGTAVTAAGSFHRVPLLSEDIGLEKEEVISENLTGRFEQGSVYDGTSMVAGTIEVEVTPKSLGAILLACVNTPSRVGSGSLSTFTFMPRTADFSNTLVNAPVTIYKQFTDADSAEQFYDCQFDSIEFQIRNGELLRARANVAGGTRAATGVGSLAIPEELPDVGRHFTWNVASISYGGSGQKTFTELTITQKENIGPLYTLDGTLNPSKFTHEGFREVTVSGTFLMADRAVLNDFVTGTKRRLIATMKGTNLTEIQSGYSNLLEIDIPQLKVTEFKPGISGVGEVEVSFSGRALIDPNSGYTIKYTLINTYAAY